MNFKRMKITVFLVVFMITALQSVYPYERSLREEKYDFAHELFLDNNFSLSESLFESFILSSPESALSGDAEFMAAETKYNTGRFKEALGSYLAIIEKYRRTKNKYKKEVYYRIAECYFQLKAYEDSAKYVKLLLDNYPESYLSKDAYLLLGENLFLSGEHDKATRSPRILKVLFSKGRLR